MKPAMSHESALALVCSVCTNLRGSKAVRQVNQVEEKLIQQHVFPLYQMGNQWFPQGLCKGCIFDLQCLSRGENKKLTLPSDYSCDIPRNLRSVSGPCSCRWCSLARLSGPAFTTWKRNLIKEHRPPITYLCTKCGQGVPAAQVSHTCSVSDLDRVQGMLESIPPEIKGRLALALLREIGMEGAGDRNLVLPQVHGGLPTQVHIGALSSGPGVLTTSEAQAMATNAHLTGAQLKSVAADLRAKFGKKLIEARLSEAIPKQNSRFAPFFTVERKVFYDKNMVPMDPKPLFFCHRLQEFLSLVAELRGQIFEDMVKLVQGDSGQGWFKLALSLIETSDLVSDGGEGSSKRRRSREDGIGGGLKFLSYGARKILILALVQGVPESNINLEIIYSSVSVCQLSFKLTGDLHFVMPSLGLMSCSSSNPCPYCTQLRTKDGGGPARWNGEGVLRTLGSLQEDYAGWVTEGQLKGAQHTRKWNSVTDPVLVMGKGDTWNMTVLDKVIPGSLHLLLALNDVFNYMEKTCWKEIKEVIQEVFKVKAHSYQGKERNYQGPDLRLILRTVHKLVPLMREDPVKSLYLDTILNFRKINSSVFGVELLPSWREDIHSFTNSISKLASFQSMPVTPKLHIITIHVEQWVDRFGRSLGRESEQSGESLHHLWKRVLEGQGEVRNKESDSFAQQTLRCLLKFNSDNV